MRIAVINCLHVSIPHCIVNTVSFRYTSGSSLLASTHMHISNDKSVVKIHPIEWLALPAACVMHR